MTIESHSLAFARGNFEQCEWAADRLLHELALLTSSIRGEPTGIERRLICDLHARTHAAEARYRHAYWKLAWEVTQ